MAKLSSSNGNSVCTLRSDNSKATTKKETSSDDIVLRNNDCLFGRGGLANKHPGNILFRRVVAENKDIYQSCKKKTHKHFLAISIIASVEQIGGRFLKRDEATRKWVKTTRKEAISKTTQALRETETKSKKGMLSVERIMEKKRMEHARNKWLHDSQPQEHSLPTFDDVVMGQRKEGDIDEPIVPIPQGHLSGVLDTLPSIQDVDDLLPPSNDETPLTLEDLSSNVFMRADIGIPFCADTLNVLESFAYDDNDVLSEGSSSCSGCEDEEENQRMLEKLPGLARPPTISHARRGISDISVLSLSADCDPDMLMSGDVLAQIADWH